MIALYRALTPMGLRLVENDESVVAGAEEKLARYQAWIAETNARFAEVLDAEEINVDLAESAAA